MATEPVPDDVAVEAPCTRTMPFVDTVTGRSF
jgi:hypothetical protein